MKRDDLVTYLDEYLGVHRSGDYADNGLQVEGTAEVQRIAYAVDACQQTIDAAVDRNAQMLVVHHGLFWGKPMRISGPHRRRVHALLNGGCSLYASHLPLDRHPEVGNNAQLARLLGLEVVGLLGEAFGVAVGIIGLAPPGLTRARVLDLLSAELGVQAVLLPEGPETVRRIGIISGSAGRETGTAALAGCDTFITGETDHGSFHDAEEYGINVIYAGHYATETIGLRALQAHLAQQFGLEGVFIDRPTGL